GCGARHARALHHGDRDPAPSQEVGHRSPHHPGATHDGVPRDDQPTQAAVRISPNSRAILRQDSPPSSLTYTSPKRLHATIRPGSAGFVAKPQMVELGRTGRGKTSQLSPPSRERSTAPVSPVVVSPQPANSTRGSSGFTAMPRA